MQIRVAGENDAAVLVEIYSYYVEKTAVTFEYKTPSVEEFAGRIRDIQKKYPYIVAEENGEILGYAYGSAFHPRNAYGWCAEMSIYVKHDRRGSGAGGRLYRALESLLAEMGVLNLNACIAVPQKEDEYLTNASVDFHKHFGYKRVGMFHRCGYKFNRWYHMVWMEKMIGEHKSVQPEVKPFTEIQDKIGFDREGVSMDEDKKKRNVIQLMLGFVRRANGDHVSAYAAQAAYFLIMSFIPFILFLTTLIRYTPLSYNVVRDAIIGFVPGNLQTFVLSIVVEVYKRSTAIVPLSALMALWASGKGMQAITNGLNTIYHVKETRNWLMNRIYSVFYMLLFVLAIIVSLLMLVLGNRIQVAAQKTIPILGSLMAKIMGARTLLVFAVLIVVFLVLYKVLPNRKATFKSQLPGAFIIAVAWLIFSYGFSLYFEFFPNFGNIYGSLTALIMVMLWLYVCMNLILYGAEINAYFENEFRRAQKSVKILLAKREAEKNANESKDSKES